MTPRPEVLTVRRSANAVELELGITETLEFLPHHFPGFPIVPGVVLLAWAVAYGAEYLGLSGSFQRIAALKFQRPMLPKSRVQLSLSRTAAGELAFSYHRGDRSYSGGRVVFK